MSGAGDGQTTPVLSTGVFSPNQSDLGQRLLPPRERKYVQRAMKLPGCPGRSADGRYHVANWQAWIQQVGPIGQTENGQGALGVLRAPAAQRKMEEQALLLEVNRKTKEWEFETKKGLYILREQATLDAAGKFLQVRTALLAIPGVLAPTIIACTDAPAAELVLREAIVKALRALADPTPAVVVNAEPQAPEAPTP